jgi:biotin synthase
MIRTPDGSARVVRDIKEEIGLAVTLSLGEHTDETVNSAIWREAGADRYLLRFETSNQRALRQASTRRPGGPVRPQAMLRTLRELGYEVGSGVMVGMPGQSPTIWPRHPALPRARPRHDRRRAVRPAPGHAARQRTRAASCCPAEQVPNTELMAYKVLALARLTVPQREHPGTTAVATLNPAKGDELALQRGANVIMPNVTPATVSRNYEIYPNKPASRVDP